ncbi:hypothetical protein ACHAWT_005137 [Skeletonema menzelii]
MLSSTRRLLPSASALTSNSCSIASRATSMMFSRGMTILSKESAEEFKKENYNARMAKTRRPVSPHVTIYSFPICALASITTRVTGCALSFGAAGLGALEIIGGNGAALSLMSDIGNSGLVLSSGAKFAVAFPIVYHYLGGLRHLVWDNAPEMLTNMDVEKTSYGLIGASVLVSGVGLVV